MSSTLDFTFYWVAVMPHNKVQRALEGGFFQVGHGNPAPLRCIGPDDWIVYYSPPQKAEKAAPCGTFTALGRIEDGQIFTYAAARGFPLARRDAAFMAAQEAPMEPLREKLTFLSDQKRWEAALRYGYVRVDKEDFRIIAAAMGVRMPKRGKPPLFPRLFLPVQAS